MQIFIFYSVKMICASLLFSLGQSHQLLMCAFLYESANHIFSLVTFWLCNFLAQKYWCKRGVQNVDEIDTLYKKLPFYFQQLLM